MLNTFHEVSVKRKSESDADVVTSPEHCGISKRVKHELNRSPYPDGDEEDEFKTPSLAGCRTRDDLYYFEDGSCIILVDDVLFNVHRTLLSKDSSMFSVMFTLPQGQRRSEGATDDDPVVLTGDTPQEFRHFLWALYALPSELTRLTVAEADLTLMMDIAKLSNKYSFRSLEAWILDVIHDYVNRKPNPLLCSSPSTNSPPPSPKSSFTEAIIARRSSEDIILSEQVVTQLVALVRLAQRCGHEKLLSTLTALLKPLIGASLQYAYLVMSLADELDLPTLRGIAYLEIMQRATVVAVGRHSMIKSELSPSSIPCYSSSSQSIINRTNTVHCGTMDADGRLIVLPEQQFRLLSGYHSLTSFWERFRQIPLHFEHSSSCGGAWNCRNNWSDFWKDKMRAESVLQCSLPDVVGKLKALTREFDKWGSTTYMHHDCALIARRMITSKTKEVDNGLSRFFDL